MRRIAELKSMGSWDAKLPPSADTDTNIPTQTHRTDPVGNPRAREHTVNAAELHPKLASVEYKLDVVLSVLSGSNLHRTIGWSSHGLD